MLRGMRPAAHTAPPQHTAPPIPAARRCTGVHRRTRLGVHADSAHARSPHARQHAGTPRRTTAQPSVTLRGGLGSLSLDPSCLGHVAPAAKLPPYMEISLRSWGGGGDDAWLCCCLQLPAPIGLSPRTSALPLNPLPPQRRFPLASRLPCPPSPSLAYPHPPYTPPSFPSGGCANGAPGPSLCHCSASGPRGGGQLPSPLATCVQADTPIPAAGRGTAASWQVAGHACGRGAGMGLGHAELVPADGGRVKVIEQMGTRLHSGRTIRCWRRQCMRPSHPSQNGRPVWGAPKWPHALRPYGPVPCALQRCFTGACTTCLYMCRPFTGKWVYAPCS